MLDGRKNILKQLRWKIIETGELGRSQRKESLLPCCEHKAPHLPLPWLTAHTLWKVFPLDRALKFIDRCCISSLRYALAASISLLLFLQLELIALPQ